MAHETDCAKCWSAVGQGQQQQQQHLMMMAAAAAAAGGGVVPQQQANMGFHPATGGSMPIYPQQIMSHQQAMLQQQQTYGQNGGGSQQAKLNQNYYNQYYVSINKDM